MSDTQFWSQLLIHYGYWIILAGTFMEGETVVILAGALAHEGYMSLPLLCLCAFAGSLASDELMFFVGRRYGKPFIENRPKLHATAQKIMPWLSRYENLLIVGFRFVYGVRNVTPVLLGSHGVHPLKFLALNTLGAAIWAVTFSLIGYGFGSLFEELMGKMQRGHHIVLIAMVFFGLVLTIWFFAYRWKRRAQ